MVMDSEKDSEKGGFCRKKLKSSEEFVEKRKK
jgi:hypothetical protein